VALAKLCPPEARDLFPIFPQPTRGGLSQEQPRYHLHLGRKTETRSHGFSTSFTATGLDFGFATSYASVFEVTTYQ
jgi:hypothetical protein